MGAVTREDEAANICTLKPAEPDSLMKLRLCLNVEIKCEDRGFNCTRSYIYLSSQGQ